MEQSLITLKGVDGRLIYKCQADSIKTAVEKAVKEGVSLYNVDLKFADLCGANMKFARMPNADLSGANLEGAHLDGIDLQFATLIGANLGYVKLNNANLCHSNLKGVNLYAANLFEANLNFANLNGANIKFAKLSCTKLCFSDLRDIKITSEIIRNNNLGSIRTDKKYIQVTCIGSIKNFITYCFDDDIIFCDCFEYSLNDFEQKCIENHKDNPKYLKEYLGFIEYIRKLK